MDNLIQAVTEYFVVSLIALCFLTGMVLKAFTIIITNSSREKSRREIAAYIAEGSMTPEQGERLIRADVNRGPARV